MRTLGLLGGMSWESTVTYYNVINRRVREKQGGLHSARCVLYSFDFADIEILQRTNEWDKAGLLLKDAATKLKLAGAEAVVLCTNTMHCVSDGIEPATALPLIHVVDPTAENIKRAGFATVALLGTRFTMEQDFYKNRLAERYGLEVVVPDEESRTKIHNVIYNELCNGSIENTSRQIFQNVIGDMKRRGAQCVILGCTEIGLLIDDSNSELPVFDTAMIHATFAADWALQTAS